MVYIIIYLFVSIEPNVGFERTVYGVSEGEKLMMDVVVSGATTLERDVVVMVMTEDGTAGMRCDSMMYIMLYIFVSLPLFLSHWQWLVLTILLVL